MTQQNKKQTIKVKAIELFSQNGFHGTSIRQIAKRSQCSIPVIYYYFNSKAELFESIVYDEFVGLIEKLNNQIPSGLEPVETYFLAIQQRKDLNKYERAIYKMALKVYFGFEGSERLKTKLQQWRHSRYERNRNILAPYISDPDQLDNFVQIIVSLFLQLTQDIVLHEEEIPDSQIKEILATLFEKYTD